MMGIVVYVVLVTIGEVGAVWLGFVLDELVPAGWSMIVALTLFFAVLVVMWPAAVYVTERWLQRRETTGLERSRL